MISLREVHDAVVLEGFRSEKERGRRKVIREYITRTGVTVPIGLKGRQKLMAELELDGDQAQSTTEPGSRSEETNKQGDDRSSKPTTANTRRFFIHRPELSTAQHQMISPVDSMTSLRDILRGKTVREFPTFLVEVPGLDEIDWTRWHLENETNKLLTES